MPEVTPIDKPQRYRRQPRTQTELDLYIRNVQARFSYARHGCEANLATCTGEAEAPHHVYPQRDGRDDSFENLRAVCRNCNEAIERMGVRSAGELGLWSGHPLGLPPDPEDAP